MSSWDLPSAHKNNQDPSIQYIFENVQEFTGIYTYKQSFIIQQYLTPYFSSILQIYYRQNINKLLKGTLRIKYVQIGYKSESPPIKGTIGVCRSYFQQLYILTYTYIHMKYNINKITEFAIYLIFDTYFIDNSGLVSFNSRSFINTFAKSLLPRSLELYYKYQYSQIYLFSYLLFHIIYMIASMICKPGNIPHSQPLIKEHSSGPFKIERICGDGQLQYQRTGRWSQLENRKYIEFLKQNQRYMQNKKSKQLWKLFKRMSKYVQTRNFRQCKNHHQELYNEFNSVKAIIEHQPYFQNRFNQNIQNIKQMVPNPSISNISGVCQKEQSVFYNTQPIIPLPIKKQLSLVKVQPTDTVNINFDLFTHSHLKFDQIQQNTGTSYLYLGDPQKSLNHKQSQISSCNSIKSPLQFLINKPNLQNMGAMSQQLNAKMMGMKMKKQERQQEWIECHKVFVMWANKLRQLITFQ